MGMEKEGLNTVFLILKQHHLLSNPIAPYVWNKCTVSILFSFLNFATSFFFLFERTACQTPGSVPTSTKRN